MSNETLFGKEDFWDFENISLKKALKIEEILEYFDNSSKILYKKNFGLQDEDFAELLKELRKKKCLFGNFIVGGSKSHTITNRGKIIYKNKILSELMQNQSIQIVKEQELYINQDNLNLLLSKKSFIEKELILTYDSEKKFALQEKIKELGNRILELKKLIETRNTRIELIIADKK